MALLAIDAVQAVGVASAVVVSVELTDQRGDPVVGFVTDSNEVILLPATQTTDENGQVAIDLVPNDEITPGNTCYTVRVASKQFLIQKAAFTQNLLDALVVAPGELTPIETNDLQDHINDSFAAHHASAIASDPFATVEAINVQAALEEIFSEATGGGGGSAATTTFSPTGDIVATNVQAAIVEVDGELHTHINKLIDSHGASSVSVVPMGDLAATNVQSALTELQGNIDASEAALAAHLVDTTDAHAASAISVVPSGDLASTTVQAALVELQGDIDASEAALAAHLADAVDAHDASAVSFVPTGNFASTNAQAAIVEAYADANTYSDAALAVHTSDTVDAHDASAISFIPANVLDNTNVQSAIEELGESFSTPKTPSGFPDTTSTTIAVTDVGANLQFTITPVGASFDVWLFGDKFTKTAESVLMADGLDRVYYVYYDAAGTLSVASNATQPTGFVWATQVPVAIVFRNASGNDLVLFDTRHGLSMDWATRGYLHTTRGTQLGSGLVLSGYTLSPGSPADADNQWALSSGTIINEDLPYTISAVADNSTYTTLYKSGTGTFSTATSFGTAVPFAVSGSDIAYNLNTAGSYSLSPVANGDFVNYLIFCTGSVTTGYQVFAFPEETTYTSLALATAAPIQSPFATGGFAFSEFFMRYRVTYQRSNAYTTTGRCRTVAVQQITNSQTIITSSSTPTSHNGLTGRDVADTHPAASITFTPAGNIAATNVQTAIAEVDSETIHTTGTESASGAKNFTTSLQTPMIGVGTAPTAASQINSAVASSITTGTANTPLVGSLGYTTSVDAAGSPFLIGTKGVVTAVVNTGATFTNAASNAIRALYGEVQLSGDGTFASSSAAVTGQTNLFAAGSILATRSLFAYGLFQSGTKTVGTSYGLDVNSHGATGVTNAVGINVAVQTGATNNYGVQIGAASTRTLWLANTTNPTTPAGGITFGSSADTNLYRSAANTLATDSNFTLTTAGRGILIKEGTNATSGVATLVAGTIVVSTTKVTANSRIQLTVQSLGTVAIPQAIGVTARTAGTSFTISSAGVTDTSVIAWTIIEPA